MKQALIIVLYLMNVTLATAQRKVITQPVSKNTETEKSPVKNERVHRNTDSIYKARREAMIARTQQRRDSMGAKTKVVRTKPVFSNDKRNNNGNSTAAPNESNTSVSKNMGTASAPDSDIDFTVTGCVGDKNAQTVTVYFTFLNTRKAHQEIWIASHLFKDYRKTATAFDTDGNQYNFGGGTLGSSKASKNISAKTQLATGVSLKGSIKYTNILPSVNKLSLVNIPSGTSNWDGGKDKKEAIIEVKDLDINWQ